ncbi:peptidase M15 [Brumimicrobium salinarum]|uniref:D-alanyl-D-alanine dipeptidase n=2 Tax=Brumimicrobium salinarum TaxID=2058658 RepID=A0A2I0R595_9FLAO|nr:peptidase M15 [Brumimicrobium salinarum]
MIAAGLVDIQKIDSTIHIDVKYATKDNFMGQVLYKNYPKVYLQKVVAERLSKAQKALQEIDPTLTLLVFDGTRPRSVQQAMWDALDTIPFSERVKFVSNPANGSIHNYGCAVDLTIANKFSKNPLDMGAGYDDLRKIAYPRHEDRFLKSGALTEVQVQNRKLLRQVMRAGGFWVIQTEWWHFNAFSRKKAKELFEIIE